jgi:uridine phosphorylase
MEELARCGATTFIRVGTCGTLLDHVDDGDMAIFDSAMRLDGASHGYAPAEFPAVAGHEIINASVAAAVGLGLKYHVGTTRSADTFYARHPCPGPSFDGFWQSDWQHHFEDLKRLNVLGAEMEASLIFVLVHIWGLRAGAISVVLDNVLRVSGESGEFDPGSQIDHNQEYIDQLARLGNDTVRLLFEADTR